MIKDKLKVISTWNCNFKPEVGIGVTELLYTDREVYTIINVSKSGKVITIQEDECTLLNQDELEFHVGGFAAHCSNQSQQRWECKPNPNGKIMKASLRKDGIFRIKGCTSSGKLVEGRHKFHDFNF